MHHSTETLLTSLMDQMLLNLDKTPVTRLVVIDYCNAFDMVDHQFLLTKLKLYGLCDNSARG